MSDKIKVAVLFGGQSSEHEISRVSAQCVLENVDPERFDIKMIGITKKGEWLPYSGPVAHIGSGDWEYIARSALSSGEKTLALTGEKTKPATCLDMVCGGDTDGDGPVDVVFPVLHGPNGEDGSVQGLLQLADIPYVGCGILASAAGMDKEFSKLVFNNAGIVQARYIKVSRNEIEGAREVIQSRIHEELGWPCFVKPANAGSSVGISKVKKPEDLAEALRFAAEYDSKILIEEFIDGREVECAVLGNDNPIASTVGEIVPCNEFYDYNAKYIDNKSEIIIPAQLEQAVIETVRDMSVRAFKALGCSGLSRVDFFIERKTGRVVLNELNTMPGFTSISMYSKLWGASGIPYSQLITRLLELANEKHEDSRKSYER